MMLTLSKDQIKGVQIIQNALSLNHHKGFILADTMGLGKSAQAIEIIKTTPDIKLIICPSYLIFNWLDEFKMWGVSENDICVIDSGKQILEDKQIYLIGYSRVINVNILKQLLQKDFSIVVCDESHYLKSWNSQRSNRVLGTYKNKQSNILYKAKNILLLTGTPILNRIEELYNIVIRVAPKALNYMSKDEFLQTYAAKYYFNGFKMVAEGVKNEDQLKEILKPILLRRTKIDGLKDRIDLTISLNPNTPELKKLFAEEEKFLLEHGIVADNVDALTKLIRIDVTKISEVRQKIALTKIPVFLEMLSDIREEDESPVVVYCYHRAVLKALNDGLKDKYPKLKIDSIDGGTALKKRHEIVKSFQSGKLDVLTATIGALREGVNLTAGARVVFLELDYVPANINQAIGRLHRRGQDNVVTVQKIIYDAGIEKRILKILLDKQNLVDKVLK